MAMSQSIKTSFDHNYDGISDDDPSETVFYQSDLFFSLKDTGDVIRYIPNPGTYCQSLAFDGASLWCSEILYGKLHQLDTINGSVIKTIDAPGIHIEGMTWDGTSLWALNNAGGPYESNTLYEINPEDGTVISAIVIDGAVWIHGITWDGQYFWMNDFDTQEIYKVDPTNGTIISRFDAPSLKSIGLSWDGTHLWSNDLETRKLYCINPADGSIVYEVNAPNGNLRDMAWDGKYLWVIERTSAIIYQVDIGHIASIDNPESLSENNGLITVYPNPVIDKTNIEFYLNTKSDVAIEIYNQQGILINSIVNARFSPGKHTIKWNITSLNHQEMPNGIYYCVLKNGVISVSKKFIIMR